MEPHETPQENHTGRALAFLVTVAGLVAAFMTSSLRVFVPLVGLTLLLSVGVYWVIREQFLRYRNRRWRPPTFMLVLLLIFGVFYNPLVDQWEREHPLELPRSQGPAHDGPFTIKNVGISDPIVGQRSVVTLVLGNSSKKTIKARSAFYMASFPAVPSRDPFRRWAQQEAAYLLALKQLGVQRDQGELSYVGIPPTPEYTASITSGVVRADTLERMKNGEESFYFALILSYQDEASEKAITYCGFMDPENGLMSLCRKNNDRDVPVSALGWERLK